MALQSPGASPHYSEPCPARQSAVSGAQRPPGPRGSPCNKRTRGSWDWKGQASYVWAMPSALISFLSHLDCWAAFGKGGEGLAQRLSQNGRY
ncbi:hypothetical protein BaRGS_00021049, partial [Batillaria attramentaria]